MDFNYEGDIMRSGGGNNALMGLMAGSVLNKDENKSMTWFAMVIILIIFFIAIIFLALAFKDKNHDRVNYHGNYGDFDKLEIMQKLEHNEDRAEMRSVKEEQNRQTQSFMQMGFGLSGQIRDTEKTALENFAKIENQMGMMQMGMTQLLQKSNNDDIIQGVINRLAYAPCYPKC